MQKPDSFPHTVGTAKRWRWRLVLAVLLVVWLSGCDRTRAKILGTWKDQYGIYSHFGADGTGYYTLSTEPRAGVISTPQGQVNYTGAASGRVPFRWTLDGNTLTTTTTGATDVHYHFTDLDNRFGPELRRALAAKMEAGIENAYKGRMDSSEIIDVASDHFTDRPKSGVIRTRTRVQTSDAK